MGFELFKRKQMAYNELMQAVEKVKAVLADLSSEELQAFLDGLRQTIEEYQRSGKSGGHEPVKIIDMELAGLFADTDSGSVRTVKPPPAKAVEAVLANHPQGLRAGEIARLCEGKFQSESDDPKGVLYSSLAFLKRSGRIAQDAEKVYHLVATRPRGDLTGKTALDCCRIILTEHAKPMNAMTITKEALERGYVGEATGTADDILMTTSKSFWSRLAHHAKRGEYFEKVNGEIFKIRPGAELTVDAAE